MDKRLVRLRREATRWGLQLTAVDGDPVRYRLGYPGGHPFESPSLAEVQNLLHQHRNALAGHRQAVA
jgi:hypothetical protein